jgi:hypothetical protein
MLMKLSSEQPKPIKLLTARSRTLKEREEPIMRSIVIATTATVTLFSSPAFTHQPNQGAASVPGFSLGAAYAALPTPVDGQITQTRKARHARQHATTHRKPQAHKR